MCFGFEYLDKVDLNCAGSAGAFCLDFIVNFGLVGALFACWISFHFQGCYSVI